MSGLAQAGQLHQRPRLLQRKYATNLNGMYGAPVRSPDGLNPHKGTPVPCCRVGNPTALNPTGLNPNGLNPKIVAKFGYGHKASFRFVWFRFALAHDQGCLSEFYVILPILLISMVRVWNLLPREAGNSTFMASMPTVSELLRVYQGSSYPNRVVKKGPFSVIWMSASG